MNNFTLIGTVIDYSPYQIFMKVKFLNDEFIVPIYSCHKFACNEGDIIAVSGHIQVNKELCLYGERLTIMRYGNESNSTTTE